MMRYFNTLIILLVMFSVGTESYFYITATYPMQFISPDTVVHRLIFYFSYFTVLSSLTLAIGCWLMMRVPYYQCQAMVILRLDGVAGVLVTGVIYNIALRSQDNPELLILKITNECLHVVIPILAIIGWWLFDPHSRINKKSIFYSIMLPIVYVFYIYIRGAMTGLYPYPILDVNIIGYRQALVNTFIIIVTFIVFTILLYLIDKYFLVKRRA